MDIMSFVTSDMVFLIPVMFVIGIVLKKVKVVPNEWIPIILIIIAMIMTTAFMEVWNDPSPKAWVVALTQGILIAGAAVLTDQVPKQLMKHVKARTFPDDGK